MSNQPANRAHKRPKNKAQTEEKKFFAGSDREQLLGSDEEKKSTLSGDYLNICVLLFLYILQGIPLGLIGSVPFILSNRGVSYSQQAVFSFVTWPFSVKLLWAPVVDSLYWERFGRRKSWLVPVQYLIGIFLILISFNIENLLNSSAGPQMTVLTVMFFALNFLAATQDIAVDGWALTMLKPTNVGYASTCNSVGQTAGYFLGNAVFLTLESADFANSYFRSTPQPYGMVDLPGFFYFWGIVFLITTTLVMLFKHESTGKSFENDNMTIRQTYSKLVDIFNLPAIRRFAFILLTCKIGFAVTDSATGLKLIEAGVHKENLALLAIPLVPLQILLPWIISRYTNGPRPLDVFIKAYPYRLSFGVVFALILWWTRYLHATSGTFPQYYYLVIIFFYGLHQITLYSMFVAVTAFHAKVSDPTIGGTYMTFLNTICNLGGNWPATVSLWFIDRLTFTSCSADGTSCAVNSETDACKANGGTCNVTIDGYNLEAIICITIGFAWYFWGRRQLTLLQNKPSSAWKCS
ncbi:PREDICTED: acetyl-coenzyme A transporter 1-like [Rhagoletis zephyria]|uniref:acetyl-coenzyme A transporter 1-like n=1 Tax=Rhagoletis zephyria TaxID=28612 RepID=UPI00081131B1|nr:PREDICTED: acetyl-coenzyme A transporter 1-like [Rhagoletis zephyria]